MGHRVSKIKPLPEQEAVTKGADFISEFFIYSVSASAIMLELARSNRDSNNKAQKLALEKALKHEEKEAKLSRRLGQLHKNIESVHEELDELKQMIHELHEGAALRKWPWFLS